ncbi:MAG: glycerol-3-phosphate 1-O-acyltransferase PlsY [Gammaproteobacteria bacterium]|nr:glycerol-3-phosphate 1-O-acyltransferase PlsY [Gammaproteobacteria bacterium]
MPAIVLVVIAYLIGSLSSAVIVCKALGLPDPRTQGSKNPGTTNVLRIGGKTAALITLLGDALKGFLPVFVAQIIGIHGMIVGVIALAAILGHIYPVFFKFEGGKGVATSFGALIALSPISGILALATWFLMVIIFRYSSLAALTAALIAPIFTLIFGKLAYVLPVIAISAIIVWRHIDNIQRLKAGTETKINI